MDRTTSQIPHETVAAIQPRRSYRNDFTPSEVGVLNNVASHCSLREQHGLTNNTFLEHPDPDVRWAADLGRREGQFLKAAALECSTRATIRKHSHAARGKKI